MSRDNSLKDKTVKGIGWSFLDNIASSGITFLVGLILANILSPEEYGIMAIITIFIAVSNSIVDSGFSSALIRKIDANKTDYDTVFYFNLGVSIILYLLLVVSAPIISVFFKEKEIIEITPAIGLILIINGLAIIPRTIYVKDINFKIQTKISFISSVISGVVGIVMALYDYSVWSLVGQQLSRQIINTVLLWYKCKWKPGLNFSLSSFKEMFSYGSKLMISGLIDTLFKNVYYFVIGKFYTPAQLGQYTRAQQFNTIFSSNLTSVIQRVSYPVLSNIQSDPERLLSAYRKVIKSTMLVTFACMIGLAAVSKPLIIILIGEKWLIASDYLQIICFSGMLYPLHAINLNILQVKGRSDIFLKLEIIKKIIAIIPILIGIYYGIVSMLLASVVTSFIAFLINSYYSADLINYSTKQQITDITPSLIISIIIASIMYSISLIDISVYAILFMQILIGFVLAIITYEIAGLSEYKDLKSIVITTLNKNKKR